MPQTLRFFKPKKQTQEEIIQEFWECLINKRDTEAWQVISHPTITFQGSLSSRIWEGYEGILQYAPLMFNRFDDFSIKVGDIITQGNISAAELTFSGLNTAGLFGSPPCGKRVTYNAVGIITVENGKIAKVRVTGNVIQIMEQMGHQV